MKNVYLFTIIVLLFQSCNTAPNNIMKKAGDNKTELQKVIDHYTLYDKDSLKLKATLFLYSNMEGYYSLNNDVYKNYLQELDSLNLYIGIHQIGQIIPLTGIFPLFDNLNQYNDLSYIKSSYLIQHIDYIFKLWKNEPWLQDITFNDICEYLLPYRILNEPLIEWEKSSKELKQYLYPLLHNYDDIKYSIGNIHKELLSNCYKYIKYDSGTHKIELPIIGKYSLTCYEQALLDLLLYRMAGIPSALDYIPCWGDANGKHFWAEPINYDKKRISNVFTFNRKIPKVYRRTFSSHQKLNNTPIQYYASDLSDPYLIDVTDEYTKCYDINIKYHRYPKENERYLAVFNNLRWCPVARSKNSNYSKMGSDILYLPICLNSITNKEQILSYPFILQRQGDMKILQPNTNMLQNLTLYRKYPYESRKSHYNSYANGTFFCGSNDEKFSNCDTLYQITSNIEMNIQHIPISSKKKYRYIKICPPTIISLSEIKFFNDHEIKVAGYKVISPYDNPKAMFDNDWFTHTIIHKELTIDLGEELQINEIVFQGKNDGNNIVIGDVYELFYMTLDGWQSCGKKIANADSIQFNNIPTNALYWLRDITKGKEERVFTTENGLQHFW